MGEREGADVCVCTEHFVSVPSLHTSLSSPRHAQVSHIAPQGGGWFYVAFLSPRDYVDCTRSKGVSAFGCGWMCVPACSSTLPHTQPSLSPSPA